MAATVGELNVKLNLELNRLDAQITQANKKISNMGRRMNSDISKAARSINVALGSLGIGVGVGALTAFGKEILDLGGKINDFSMQAGIGTEAFQVLAETGRDSGVSGEQIAQAFTRMGITIQDAAEGTKTAVATLAKLNLTAAGLKALKPERQFEAIALSIAEATDKEKAFNAALEILGAKTAPKLREVLERLGVEGFDKLRESLKDRILTDEQIATIDELGDKIGALAYRMQAAGAKAALFTLDGVTAEIERVYALMKKRFEKSPFQTAMDTYMTALVGGPVGLALLARGTIGEEAEASKGPPAYLDPLSGRAGVTPQQIDRIREANALKAQMDAAEATAKALAAKADAEKLSMSQAATRQRISAEDAKLNEELAKSFKKINEAAEKADEEIGQFLETMRDGVDPSREIRREIDKIGVAFQKGLITQDEAASFLDRITDPEDTTPEKPKLTDYQKFQDQVFSIFDSVGDRAASTFADMVLTGENAFDSLVDVVARSMLEMVARLAIINPIMNAVFGLGGAGTGTTALATLGSVFGGGKASGGSVSGGMSYLVGEKGPEIFSPNTSGAIIPNNKLGMGGVGVSNYYSIDARGASVDAIRELRMQMSALNSSIEVRAVAANRDADRRRK